MSNDFKKIKLKDLYTLDEHHKLMSQLCGKSQDTGNYPNFTTYMDTFREPFFLSMALGVKCIQQFKPLPRKETHTVPATAIHTKFELIIKAIAYWWELKTNKSSSPENVLVNPNKIKEIAEGFAYVGFEELRKLTMNRQFQSNLLEKIKELNDFL